MTVWKAGMLAVAVGEHAMPAGHVTDYGFVIGRAYMVSHVVSDETQVGLVFQDMPPRTGKDGWRASNFRPAVSDDQACEEEFITLLKRFNPTPALPHLDGIVVHPDRKGTLSSNPVRVVRISANSGTDGGRAEANSVPEIVSHTDVSGTPERSHNTGRCFTNTDCFAPLHDGTDSRKGKQDHA